jgi:hypothetical protein
MLSGICICAAIPAGLEGRCHEYFFERESMFSTRSNENFFPKII